MNQAKNHDPLSQQCYAFRLTEISERPFWFFSEIDHPETMYTSILGDSLWGQHSGSERGRLLTLLIWRSGYKNSAEAWPRLHAATVYRAHAVYLWFESIWSLWKMLKIIQEVQAQQSTIYWSCSLAFNESPQQKYKDYVFKTGFKGAQPAIPYSHLVLRA